MNKINTLNNEEIYFGNISEFLKTDLNSDSWNDVYIFTPFINSETENLLLNNVNSSACNIRLVSKFGRK